MRRLAVSGVSLLLLVYAARCGGGSGAKPPINDPTVDQVSFRINAKSGGSYPLPGGATVVVPAGALDADTEVTVKVPKGQTRASRAQKFDFQPSGLTFKQPITLRIAYDKVGGAEPLITGYMAGPSEPLHKAASELTNAVPLEAFARDEAAGTLDVKVPHFTFFIVLVQVDRYIYVVPEIPANYLAPGDLLFVLTLGDKDPGPNWNPGHVGVFVGGGKACEPPSGDPVIESTPPKVRETSLMAFRTLDGHQYLGARRPGGTPLSGAEKKAVVDFCKAQREKPYSLVFGQGNVASANLASNGLDPNTGFSCVGLAEASYDSVDRGSLEAREALISTPLELYDATVPVEEITMGVGEKLSGMRLRNLVVHPASPYVGTMVRGWYCDGYPCRDPDGNEVDPETQLLGVKPDTLTLNPAGRGHYTIDYQAVPEDAGKSFDMTFETSAFIKFSSPAGSVNIGQQKATARLKINVVPCKGVTPPGCYLPTDPPRVQVACLVGDAPAKLSALAPANSVTLPAGGTHGNSNTLLGEAGIALLVDLLVGTSFAEEWTPEYLLASYGNTYFPCGAGTYGTTLCPPMAAAQAPGQWFVVQMELGADVPLMDPTYSFQYGFVFDADDDASNNYVASAQFADDYYQGTDRWYSAEYKPATGWELKVSDARGGQIKPMASAARVIIAKNTLTLTVPAAELAAPNPGYRLTAFRHKGDYGQNPPHDYSADTAPPVRTPLRRVTAQ